MKTLTIKNVPDDLHAGLKAAAERSRRSMNGEAILLLSESLERRRQGNGGESHPRHIEEFVRRQPGASATVVQIAEWIRTGRDNRANAEELLHEFDRLRARRRGRPIALDELDRGKRKGRL